MPALLETIDAIARRLKRDVIFLNIRDRQDRPTRDRPEIAAATAWLDAEGIGRVVDVDIVVRRAEKPSDGSFFSLFSGMFS